MGNGNKDLKVYLNSLKPSLFFKYLYFYFYRIFCWFNILNFITFIRTLVKTKSK